MARPSLKLIRAIRNTARKLSGHVLYQWGHMGSCNCGHLAQELTSVTRADIHSFAMHSEGSWTDQSRSYCPTSGLPMDLLISSMLDYGLEIDDLGHLERLSDPEILKYLGVRKLMYNQRHEVVQYLEAWAHLLEEKLIASITLIDLRAITKTEPSRESSHPLLL